MYTCIYKNSCNEVIMTIWSYSSMVFPCHPSISFFAMAIFIQYHCLLETCNIFIIQRLTVKRLPQVLKRHLTFELCETVKVYVREIKCILHYKVKMKFQGLKVKFYNLKSCTCVKDGIVIVNFHCCLDWIDHYRITSESVYIGVSRKVHLKRGNPL